MKLKKYKKKLSLALILSIIGLIAFCIFFYFYILKDLPNPYGLKDYKIIPVSSRILDRNGRLLHEIYKEEKRTPIKLSALPVYVKQATIAVEDKDFYQHQGVSIFGGILRALKDTFLLKKGLQGGSTITQQLVKSALLTPERTVRRKIREIILALWAEKVFTKDQIIELYLNQVPYGGASYGIEEAAQTFYGKSAHELTLSQAALLAGLPQAPSLYSPFANPQLAIARRNEVLTKMAEQKYISEDQKLKAQAEDLAIISPKINIKAPHFIFYIKSILEKQFGAVAVEEGGLKVTTTLDLDLQEKAEKILSDELSKIKYLDVSNGAVLVSRPSTGEILTMVGSVDYFATGSGTFNVTTALRQPGSAIKPINYAIGLERKLVTPATVFVDAPTCFSAAGQPKPYCPQNYDGKFHGPVQLRFALGNSYNIPAVKMLQINGVENFVASSSGFLITSLKDPTRYGLSLTLGGGEVSMIEMNQAFSAFANEGIPRKLVAILKVTDKNGKLLYQYKDTNLVKEINKPLKYPKYLAISGKRAISQETAFLISHILLDNFARSQAFGTTSFLVVPKHNVSVKTGTTDDKRDNWTIGYTPNFLTSVWVGNNDNSPMNPTLSSGVTGAAPIWNRVMQEILKNQPDLFPRKPSGVVGRQVCADFGGATSKKEDGSDSCQTRFEYFIKGSGNGSDVRQSKQTVPVNRDTGKLTKPEDPAAEMKEKTIIQDGDSMFCLDCAN